jgi:hypothetical protein
MVPQKSNGPAQSGTGARGAGPIAGKKDRAPAIETIVAAASYETAIFYCTIFFDPTL